jgi:hypothetical protein
MPSIIHAVGLIVTTAIVVLVFIFVIADSAARLEFIREKLPWLQPWLEKRSSVVYLLVVAIFLQAFFLSELKDKEIPPVPIFSPVFTTIPAPVIHEEDRTIVQEVNRPTVAPVLRREPSLRDRATELADELEAFTEERDKHMPPMYVRREMSPEERQAAQAPQLAYRQENYKIYYERFSVRVLTVVAEFKALGLDVSSIENCAASGMCSPTPIPIELHALAARLDDDGNVRRAPQ